MVSIENIKLNGVIAYLKNVKETIKSQSIEEQRIYLEQNALLIACPEDVTCESVNIDGIYAEWISTPESQENKIILYLHGGYYMVGSCNTHRDLASQIAKSAKAYVLIPEYRLAPEHPFPAGLEDVLTAYNWLLAYKKNRPCKIIIAGDSAGGGLTLSMLLKLKDSDAVLPAAGICMSPWTDLANTGNSFKTKAYVDPFVEPEWAQLCAKLYLGKENPKNPFASPLYGDLHGLPPLLLQVGSEEILLDDTLRFADRATACGVSVKLEVWEKMIHVFQAYAGMIPEGRQAIRSIGKFIDNLNLNIN